MGEVHVGPTGREEFSAGISHYPYLGAIAHRIRSADLARIYDTGQNENCVIGKLTQDESLDADHPRTLYALQAFCHRRHDRRRQVDGRHAAAAQGDCGGSEAACADPRSAQRIRRRLSRSRCRHRYRHLDLPFWLMRLEEFAEVIFRGRPAVPEELDILRDVIPEAKKAFKGSGEIRPCTPDQRKKLDHRRYAGPLPHGRSAGADRRAHRPAGRTQREAASCAR